MHGDAIKGWHLVIHKCEPSLIENVKCLLLIDVLQKNALYVFLLAHKIFQIDGKWEMSNEWDRKSTIEIHSVLENLDCESMHKEFLCPAILGGSTLKNMFVLIMCIIATGSNQCALSQLACLGHLVLYLIAEGYRRLLMPAQVGNS